MKTNCHVFRQNNKECFIILLAHSAVLYSPGFFSVVTSFVK